MASSEEIRWRAADLLAAASEGALIATIHDVLPLEHASSAHNLMEGRETRGKLLLAVG
jgi:NADPH:quinone reductase-like Zn-dependent oxidoreductase